MVAFNSVFQCLSSSIATVSYYIRKRLKLEEERENRDICAKKRTSVRAVVLMATPCTMKYIEHLSS